MSVMSCVVAPQWHHSPSPSSQRSDDLLHHAEDRIADALGLLLELGEVDVLDPALALDLARGLLGDDAEAALRPRQRRLDLQVIAGAALVGENLAASPAW